MERLTFEGMFCDIARCTGDDCSGACSQKETWDRLKSIEDILGDNYDLDRLRELVGADRAERCFISPVLPDLRPGIASSECFILLDSGEIVSDNVCSILIGPDGSGEVNMLFDTLDSGLFDADDIRKRIFWKIEDAQKAAAALKGGRDA